MIFYCYYFSWIGLDLGWARVVEGGEGNQKIRLDFDFETKRLLTNSYTNIFFSNNYTSTLLSYIIAVLFFFLSLSGLSLQKVPMHHHIGLGFSPFSFLHDRSYAHFISILLLIMS